MNLLYLFRNVSCEVVFVMLFKYMALKYLALAVVAHDFYPSTWEAEVG